MIPEPAEIIIQLLVITLLIAILVKMAQPPNKG